MGRGELFHGCWCAKARRALSRLAFLRVGRALSRLLACGRSACSHMVGVRRRGVPSHGERRAGARRALSRLLAIRVDT